MNQGVVIKTNANQRYTSNAPTTFLLRRIAKKAGVKVQDFEIRNDSVCPLLFSSIFTNPLMSLICELHVTCISPPYPCLSSFLRSCVADPQTCGSTVGPHLSTHVRTVDIGLAQLSMHSIRETGGSADVRPYIDLFRTFFEGFAEIERDLRVD